ncbi:MAG: tRNA pseudouridine(55) synthase TruB [Alphaproteobacteria bacterium]|nr:MAG: tRNA pseudouridine(55) synthase TruB [Alphaproteobacteria bacterium]
MARRQRKGRPIDGWINLDKPAGMTSAHAVAKVKRLLDAAKVGHGGTLDPMATGVLPIALGAATKLLPYVVDREKVYDFTIRWGEDRDTDDAEGAVTDTSPKRPSLAAIDAALPAFTGDILQVPPAYSAVKVAGQRAYDLARAGAAVALAPRPVRVMAFARRDGHDGGETTSFRVRCGKGTYVRALARDLAHRLGTCGHVAALTRVAVGPFALKQAISLESLAELGHKAPRDSLIAPLTAALDDIPAIAVTAAEARRLRSGGTIRHLGLADSLYGLLHDGQLVALARVGDGVVEPVRVFNQGQGRKRERTNDVD